MFVEVDQRTENTPSLSVQIVKPETGGEYNVIFNTMKQFTDLSDELIEKFNDEITQKDLRQFFAHSFIAYYLRLNVNLFFIKKRIFEDLGDGKNFKFEVYFYDPSRPPPSRGHVNAFFWMDVNLSRIREVQSGLKDLQITSPADS